MVKCKWCNKTFKNQAALNRHTAQSHKIQGGINRLNKKKRR